MLDDMAVLRAAVDDYRRAAIAAGVPWRGDGARPDCLPLGELRRVFGVGAIAEQVIWLNTEALPHGRVLPGGAFPLPWNNACILLDDLSTAVGVPFHWRHQVPLLAFDHLVFTFVLAGEREGEVWRYQIDPDDWCPMRAAPSLAAMFTEWTKGFAAGVYRSSEHDGWLHVEEGCLAQRGLDPFAFPVFFFPDGEGVRARQVESGVDVDGSLDPGRQEELLDEVGAVRAALRL